MAPRMLRQAGVAAVTADTTEASSKAAAGKTRDGRFKELQTNVMPTVSRTANTGRAPPENTGNDGLHLWCFWHEQCGTKRARQNFGCSDSQAAQKLSCRACHQRFSIRKGTKPFWQKKVDEEHPWYCSTCNRVRAKECFSVRQQHCGTEKKCRACTC
jgi:hypothetical protein